MVWTLPNILTVTRIVLAPIVALLPLLPGYFPKLVAFVVFLAAAISDIYDGRLARERGQITDLGALLDPLADKLLLFATLIPIYVITRSAVGQYEMPLWGAFPLWVALLLVGRELAMTGIRQLAKRRGIVIAAAGAGKAKTIVQDIFMGAALLWFAWQDLRVALGWENDRTAAAWEWLHGMVTSITLGVAVILTAYSLLVYLYRYRHVLRGGLTAPGTPGDGA